MTAVREAQPHRTLFGLKVDALTLDETVRRCIAAAEALLLAQRAGLDPALALRALSDGAGSSRMLEVRGPMMIAGDFSQANMRLEYYQKDIDLISDLGRTVRCPLPLFTASAQLHLAALAQGRLDEDPACVFAVLEGMSRPQAAPGSPAR